VNTETIFSAISVDIKCSELDASFFLAISENDEVKITENAKKGITNYACSHIQ